MTRVGKHRTANFVFGRLTGRPAVATDNKSADPAASADNNSVATDNT